MRQFVSIALLLLLVAHLVMKVSVVAIWKINQEQIAKTLCENRDKPMLHCHGKCQLRKQLRMIEMQENSNTNSSILKLKGIDAFVFNEFMLNFNHTENAIQNTQLYKVCSNLYAFLLVKKNNKPPCVSV